MQPPLLRYRFDTLAQFRQHLHALDDRSVLFFRATEKGLRGGDKILLEVSFAGSEQTAVLRGQVLSVVEGAQSGLWLEFADLMLPRMLSEPSAEAKFASRKQRRLPAAAVVEAMVDTGQKAMARLIDLSLGGARLAGFALPPGRTVELRLLQPVAGVPSNLGRAAILRSGGGETALRFERADPATRKAVTALFDSLRSAWATTPEMVHPALCCRGGAPTEPPIPRLRARD